MRPAEYVFELILRFYPSDFRRQYGDEMRAFVRARLGEPRYATGWGAFGFVCHMVVDGVAGAVREHLAARAAFSFAPDATTAREAPVSDNEPREELMATLVHDARYAVRTLRRRPAFTIASAITLALGIRATSAIGSKRVLLALVGVFASVALLLAGVGIFGVMSFAVAQRTHEVGVRMALGASGGEVLRMIVGQGLRLTLVALLLGLAAAAGATRLMASQLFGVTASDPLTFATVPVVLCAVAGLACYLPARRASRLDPLTALRRE
jgi:hypothetical protein